MLFRCAVRAVLQATAIFLPIQGNYRAWRTARPLCVLVRGGSRMASNLSIDPDLMSARWRSAVGAQRKQRSPRHCRSSLRGASRSDCWNSWVSSSGTRAMTTSRIAHAVESSRRHQRVVPCAATGSPRIRPPKRTRSSNDHGFPNVWAAMQFPRTADFPKINSTCIARTVRAHACYLILDVQRAPSTVRTPGHA